MITMQSVAKCPYCSEEIWMKRGISIERARKLEIEDPPTNDLVQASAFDRELIETLLSEGKALDLIDVVRGYFAAQHVKEHENFSRSQTFTCPYCDAPVQAIFKVAFLGIVAADQPIPPTIKAINVAPLPPAPVDALAGLIDEDRQLYEEWSANNLLHLFMKALEIGNPGSVPQKPKGMVNVIKGWFKTCEVQMVPAQTISKFANELGTNKITFYGAQSVFAVIADGYIKTFIPQTYAHGYGSARPSLKNGKPQFFDKRVRELRFEQDEIWAKTRYGYCLGRGVFFGALYMESRAAQGSATRTQRGTEYRPSASEPQDDNKE